MCGRFAFYSPAEAAAALFGVTTTVALQPRYNIAPTQDVAAVRLDTGGERELAMLRWGLVPSWARDKAIGNRMINARAETVAEKPSFRSAFRHRRCVVLADGFYEWRRQNETKTPFYISLSSAAPFALAALWENWQDKESGDALQTTALITAPANDFMQPLHHRMPVILQAEAAGEWLAGTLQLEDYAARRTPALQAFPVDRRVNNARNEGEALIEPAGDILR
ncbi:MAG: SOS response-associated peptidase [Woeseiaceae bacterium]|nr:SOS response-associated peptidase [Woeseiaceae bacterium]